MPHRCLNCYFIIHKGYLDFIEKSAKWFVYTLSTFIPIQYNIYIISCVLYYKVKNILMTILDASQLPPVGEKRTLKTLVQNGDGCKAD